MVTSDADKVSPSMRLLNIHTSNKICCQRFKKKLKRVQMIRTDVMSVGAQINACNNNRTTSTNYILLNNNVFEKLLIIRFERCTYQRELEKYQNSSLYFHYVRQSCSWWLLASHVAQLFWFPFMDDGLRRQTTMQHCICGNANVLSD